MSEIPLGPFPDQPGFEQAEALDREDPLAEYSLRFVRDDPELIYLDGNSLGRLPLKAAETVDRVVNDEWGRRLIRSWNESWWDLQIEIGNTLAPLIGARPGEVIISDSTSVNLFKLASAALSARPGRTRLVTDDLNFPSDVYVLRSVAEQQGGRLQIVPSDGVIGPVGALREAIDETTALVSLSHTTFKSGYTYDLASLTEAAHHVGALVLWDLSHSAGVVPVDLGAAGADLAVGCTYKYLNGGPGSPAFLYVRSDLQDELANPITAWWGHAEPFAFDLEYRPVHGIRKFHTGTMPIISLAAAGAGIEQIAGVGIGPIRAKSVSLTRLLIELAESHLSPIGFRIVSPLDPEHRGGHVSLSHPDGRRIARAMIEAAKVVPDFRAPDNIRVAPVPLYTTHVEVHTAVHRVRAVVESGAHLEVGGDEGQVT